MCCRIKVARRLYTTGLAPTPPTGVKIRRRNTKFFPLSWKDSFAQWTRRKDLETAEFDVLSCVGLNPKCPNPDFKVRSHDVEVSPGQFVNELEVSTTPNTANSSATRHVVLVHGYGASKGYFYQNFRSIASIPNITLHAIDWLGYGRSTRVPIDLVKGSRRDNVLRAERFFSNSLESWRQKRGIEKLSIIAHSLGAYVSASYAFSHPHIVDKMAFVSPASVDRTSESIPRKDLGLEDPKYPLPRPRFPVPGWFRWGWERNFSPFFPVRLAGPWGPKLVSMWTSRRFAKLPQKDKDALQMYAYAMFTARGSGEYLLNSLLAPGGVARWPLVERIHHLSPKIPTLWLYGDHDWMDINGGNDAADIIRANGGEANVVSVPRSGHHLYLDNAAYFNEIISEFLK